MGPNAATQASDDMMTVISNWMGSDRFRSRSYQSYEAYIEHQAAKLRTLNLERYNKEFKPALLGRIGNLNSDNPLPRGTTVLCLGARNGIECEAFIELGCFAVGIDLNPGTDNRFVVTGDFHALQFADQSVDIVFTNALDHAFELPKIIHEIRRVLKQSGMLVAEIVRGSKDEGGREPGDFESVWWDHSQVVVEAIVSEDFKLKTQNPFTYPWVGDQYVFTR